MLNLCIFCDWNGVNKSFWSFGGLWNFNFRCLKARFVSVPIGSSWNAPPLGGRQRWVAAYSYRMYMQVLRNFATEDFKIRHFLRLSPTPLTKMTKNAAAKTCKLTMGSSISHTRPSASSRSGAWIGNWIPSASLQRELCNRSVNLLITGSCQKDLFIKIWERQSALTWFDMWAPIKCG